MIGHVNILLFVLIDKLYISYFVVWKQINENIVQEIDIGVYQAYENYKTLLFQELNLQNIYWKVYDNLELHLRKCINFCAH